MQRDLMFGWQLYFGELPEEEGPASAGSVGGAEGGDGSSASPGERGGRNKDLEYGWRLYFNELPVDARALQIPKARWAGPARNTSESVACENDQGQEGGAVQASAGGAEGRGGTGPSAGRVGVKDGMVHEAADREGGGGETQEGSAARGEAAPALEGVVCPSWPARERAGAGRSSDPRGEAGQRPSEVCGMLMCAVEERPRSRGEALGGGGRSGVHEGVGTTGTKGPGDFFERRPSDMQELVELSKSPASACSPGHKHMFARIKVCASENPRKTPCPVHMLPKSQYLGSLGRTTVSQTRPSSLTNVSLKSCKRLLEVSQTPP